MSIRVWLSGKDIEKFSQLADPNLEYYGQFDLDLPIFTGSVKEDGIFSKLKNDFVLGKIKFWEHSGSIQRFPFVRINNHLAYPNGLVLTTFSRIDIKYNKKRKTIDQRTDLRRIELLNAADNDFVKRVFVTYNVDSLISKPRDFERHLLLYCHEKFLDNGRVPDPYSFPPNIS